MRRLPPLALLRAFEATARHESVTKAADELFRTHGAVSRQLKLLQEHFGAPLFDKEGTGLKLNKHGKALYAVLILFAGLALKTLIADRAGREGP